MVVSSKDGSIVLAYGFGLIIGSTGILPQGSDGYKLALQGKAALPRTEVEALLVRVKQQIMIYLLIR